MDDAQSSELVLALTSDNEYNSFANVSSQSLLVYTLTATNKARSKSEEEIYQQRNLKQSLYMGYVTIKYAIFIVMAIVLTFPNINCKSGLFFFPLYIFGISFIVIVIMSIVAMCHVHRASKYQRINGLSLLVFNMFTTFYFLYLTFKARQCQLSSTDYNICEISTETENSITWMDIVIMVMGCSWIFRIILYCKCCGTANDSTCCNYMIYIVREWGLYYLIVIVWVSLILSLMVCSLWQASIDIDVIYFLLPIRLVVFCTSMDGFVLETTRTDGKELLHRMKECCSKKNATKSYVENLSHDAQ